MMKALHGKHCKLTAISQEKAEMLLELMDNDFRNFLPEFYDVFHDKETVERFLESFCMYECDGSGYLWGIHIGDVLIGFVAIMDIPYHSTIFYAIHPDYRHKGIITESVTMAVDYYMKQNEGIPLYTEVYSNNIASLKVLSHIPSINVTIKEEHNMLMK